MKKEWIENIVVRYTKEILMQDDVIEDIANIVLRVASTENTSTILLKQRLSETERAIANLINAIEQGIITTTTKQRMIELENTKEELELKIIKEELKRPPLTKEGLIFWLQRFRSLDTTKKEHKQRLIDSFVNAVYVYDDKLVLTFNYNEANTTVTLDEVNGSIIECSGAPKSYKSMTCSFFNFSLQTGEPTARSGSNCLCTVRKSLYPLQHGGFARGTAFDFAVNIERMISFLKKEPFK